MAEEIVIGVVGDKGVGKTSLRVMYLQGHINNPQAEIERERRRRVTLDETEYSVGVYDSGGGEEYRKLRPFTYIRNNVVLMCFSVDSRPSLESIETTYLPEINLHLSSVHKLLVACKTDLRDTSGEDTISQAEGQALATRLKCDYYETSGILNSGVDECFNAALKKGILHKHPKTKKRCRFKNNKCTIV